MREPARQLPAPTIHLSSDHDVEPALVDAERDALLVGHGTQNVSTWFPVAWPWGHADFFPLGTVSMIDTIATPTISTLKPNATMAA